MATVGVTLPKVVALGPVCDLLSQVSLSSSDANRSCCSPTTRLGKRKPLARGVSVKRCYELAEHHDVQKVTTPWWRKFGICGNLA